MMSTKTAHEARYTGDKPEHKREAGPKPWETSKSWSFWARLDLVLLRTDQKNKNSPYSEELRAHTTEAGVLV
jgi:hypothetical protein